MFRVFVFNMFVMLICITVVLLFVVVTTLKQDGILSCTRYCKILMVFYAVLSTIRQQQNMHMHSRHNNKLIGIMNFTIMLTQNIIFHWMFAYA